MADVELVNLSKRYRDGTNALEDLNLKIEDGEFLVLVGPSGCGKSTALRMIAGLEEITRGEVRIDGRRVNEVPPAKRDIAMVFQNYALYPHMTVEKNLEIGLKMRKVPKEERKRRIQEAAAMLHIEDYLHRKPARLSGGQRQRVAMGRATVRDPAVFLLDEPLSNLDAKLRAEVRADIKLLQRNLGTTTIFVTHDQIEAMTMAHRIALLRKGQLQQVGTPAEIYTQPANLFVGGFIGSPPMNFLSGVLEVDMVDGINLRLGKAAERWRLGDSRHASQQLKDLAGRNVVAGVRPEHLELSAGEMGHVGGLRGSVALLESLGSDTLIYLNVQGSPVRQHLLDEALAPDDEEQGASTADGITDSVRFCARVPEIVNYEIGTQVEVSVARGFVYCFDPNSGELLGTLPLEPRNSVASKSTAGKATT